MLHGFQELAPTFGYEFKVTPSMVGVSSKDEIKVWVHKDFHRSQVDYEFAVSASSSEAQLVQRLYQIAEQSTPCGFSPHFRDHFRTIPKLTCQAAKDAIYEYARALHWQTPSVGESRLDQLLSESCRTTLQK
jgi:hypothetical protein